MTQQKNSLENFTSAELIAELDRRSALARALQKNEDAKRDSPVWMETILSLEARRQQFANDAQRHTKQVEDRFGSTIQSDSLTISQRLHEQAERFHGMGQSLPVTQQEVVTHPQKPETGTGDKLADAKQKIKQKLFEETGLKI